MTWFEVDCADYACRRLEPFGDRPEAAALIERWRAWAQEYKGIYERSPKWRLKEMISEVSESHHFISWPKRWERSIWEWALSPADTEPLPFDDRKGIMDADFKRRLKTLVQLCDGFLYRCEETEQIVFAPTATLPRIWEHQDHLAQIDRQKPFGFFHDASRPDWRKHWRAPTEEEERTLLATRPKESPGLTQRLWQRFRAWLSP